MVVRYRGEGHFISFWLNFSVCWACVLWFWLSQLLVQWYMLLFSLPPLLLSLTSAFSTYFLEAQDPVDSVFFFPLRWDKKAEKGGCWSGRNALPPARIRLSQRIFPWSVVLCYRELWDISVITLYLLRARRGSFLNLHWEFGAVPGGRSHKSVGHKSFSLPLKATLSLQQFVKVAI